MILAVAKERELGETRVALIPESVKKLTAAGFAVVVEQGAGELAGFSDQDYREAGAKVEADPYQGAQMVARVTPPSAKQAQALPKGCALAGFIKPYHDPSLVQVLAKAGVTTFSVEMIPRISRAQSMDALTSMATVAGYKAVLLAAEKFHRFFPMFMSAAGTITPAKVLVLGAGVAGLQAIATARRLGAVVEAFDTRPVVKDQVESLGARFVELEVDHAEAEDKGGYAKALSQEHHQKELELIARHIEKSDVVITTAAIPGKKSPILITQPMVKSMKAGSIIVDLAAEGGGNCELTQPGQDVTVEGVTIMGRLNLPAEMAQHASLMYSRNMTNLLLLLAPKGELQLNLEDEIIKGSLITHQGQVVHPALAAKPA